MKKMMFALGLGASFLGLALSNGVNTEAKAQTIENVKTYAAYDGLGDNTMKEWEDTHGSGTTEEWEDTHGEVSMEFVPTFSSTPNRTYIENYAWSVAQETQKIKKVAEGKNVVVTYISSSGVFKLTYETDTERCYHEVITLQFASKPGSTLPISVGDQIEIFTFNYGNVVYLSIKKDGNIKVIYLESLSIKVERIVSIYRANFFGIMPKALA